MTRSLLLLLGSISLSFALRAQTPRTDTVLPQKLQLKKNDSAWMDHPAYAAKANRFRETDTARSLMYTGPAKKDSMQLQLPSMKTSKLNFQIKAGRNEPLFRRQ